MKYWGFILILSCGAALAEPIGPGDLAAWRAEFADASPSETAQPGASDARDIDLASAVWTAQPGWLGNPSSENGVGRDPASGVTTFCVNEAARGMKWHAGLGDGIDLRQYRYVTMRYKAINLTRYYDYALAFLSKSDAAYADVVRGFQLRPDGQWHVAVAPLNEASARFGVAGGMAIQVQTSDAPGEIHIDSVRLATEYPRTAFADQVNYSPGAAWDAFQTIDLGPACNQSLDPVLDLLHLQAWPESNTITSFGIPFELRHGAEALAATGIKDTGQLAIPVGVKTRQVYLLMLTAFRGMDDAVYGGGPLQRIGDVDRFLVSLEYDDGLEDACLPANVANGAHEVVSGAQVLCVFCDPTKTLERLVVADRTAQGGFAVAAVTCRTATEPLFAAWNESNNAVPLKGYESAPERGANRIVYDPETKTARLENGLLSARIAMAEACGLLELDDKAAKRAVVRKEAGDPLFAVMLDDRTLPSEEIRLAQCSQPNGPDTSIEAVYEVASCAGLRIEIAIDLDERGALRFRGRMVNAGSNAITVGIVAPRIGPYVLGERLAANEYVFPCRAARIGRENVSLSERYSGLFNVQFMATANPVEGQSLNLRTEDTTCIERYYELSKDERGMSMAVRYPARAMRPGETRALADTILAVSNGDWHTALDDYRRWLDTWYKPASPRKAWFREVFNFRQRFLHWLDPLYNGETIDLQRALDEGVDQFGGIDYLHLFDWGNCGPYGRIYGRVGDYSPYDYLKGGLPQLHDAIAGIRAKGVPVGLYIEGYLLGERGKLGVEHGSKWQLIGADGRGARWPDSSEIFICPGVEEWRAIQAATYAAKVRELDADGMYIDEFGFTGVDKDCHSADHGHTVPSYCVQTELEMTKAVRVAIDAVKPGVAIYTEESPCDVTSQYQDGSFTYVMNQHVARGSRIPINLFRFAIPDLKTFEILFCDKPSGSWATGVHWTFFNGEGIWLEGPGAEWFSEDMRAAIRKGHAILREHRAAFTTPHPRPLMPTLMDGVHANYFPSEHEEVWTLYNARYATARGAVLRVPHREGWTWRDVWNDAAPTVLRDGDDDVVEAAVGPMNVGCLARVKG